MTGRLRWQRALDRERVASAQAEQRAIDAHMRAIEAASLGVRAESLSKVKLRKIGADAVAKFSGVIRHIPGRVRK